MQYIDQRPYELWGDNCTRFQERNAPKYLHNHILWMLFTWYFVWLLQVAQYNEMLPLVLSIVTFMGYKRVIMFLCMLINKLMCDVEC